ncbi:acyl carrier protein [Inconstantimicrobium mannanitabidum]|uniref:Uncharacterized protein n=1 Tax=Inconstantimicrobium mannanitabidum TaxID=1604901 RepID=A0ACB5RH32_9CLOT|nr:acyl carrier protein [Clostridium sp. TW13]GKX68388.1 hypothetical protein rsdtw13_36460 [Clostridium sp. TW13]
MEQKIRNVVGSVLGLSEKESANIDQNESLLDYGLDSMNSIEIIVSIEEEFSISIEVEDLTVESVGSINGLIKLVNKYL